MSRRFRLFRLRNVSFGLTHFFLKSAEQQTVEGSVKICELLTLETAACACRRAERVGGFTRICQRTNDCLANRCSRAISSVTESTIVVPALLDRCWGTA